MPNKSDELMGLAEVYADALLGAAAGNEEQVFAEFTDLIGYMDQDPAFAAFLTADSVDDDARRTSLEKLFRGRLSDTLLNLLQVLNHRNRAGEVRAVYRSVQLRMEARHDQQEVIVETAMPLNDELRAGLKHRLGEYTGKEPILIERVVPDLIGGIVVRINDVQIDASVVSRIRSLRGRFGERAAHEIHASKGVEQ